MSWVTVFKSTSACEQKIAKKHVHVHSFQIVWMIMFMYHSIWTSQIPIPLSVNYLLYKFKLLTISNIRDGVMNIPYKIIHVFL